MFGLKDIDTPAYKYELEQQLNLAREVKRGFKYLTTISVHRLWFNPKKFTIGFNFMTGVNPGDIYYNDDHSRCDVIALV